MAPKSVILSDIAEIYDGYPRDVLDRHAALKTAHEFSRRTLDTVRERIRTGPPGTAVHTVAIAGSLARLEASDQSDLDLIISLHPSGPGEAAPDPQPIMEWRDSLCDELKLDRPNQSGVFHNPICRSHLAKIAGRSGEPYEDVAKRILFLLESEWLYNQDNYDTLLGEVIDAYSEDVRRDPRKNFVFLLNDVVRFFRSLCVNYQFNKADTEDGKWPIRNVKLRHSRVLMYFSMVAAIGALSRQHTDQKIEALKELIRMEPLRRLYVAYGLARDPGFFKVAGAYNTFLHLLSQSSVREELAGLDYDKRYSSAAFAQLKANSDGLSSELLRFYEARRRDWDDRFFEYMII